jgi:hypothetical protein
MQGTLWCSAYVVVIVVDSEALKGRCCRWLKTNGS